MGANTLPEDMRKAQDRFGSVDGGNDLTFAGDTTFSGTPTFSGVPATVLAGDNTFTGDNTFSGDNTINGATGIAAATIAVATIASLGYTASQTIVATDTGATTGTIADSGMLLYCTVDCDGDANHIFILPTPTPGTIVIAAVGATGCEMRSSAPATVAINGGSEANAESAIAASDLVIAICESATSWKAFAIASDGTTAGVEAAAAS